jgi:predicted nucleic acid-binding protein
MALIVDSSVAIAWAIDTQANPMTRAALVAAIDSGFVAPHHFPIEVAHNLLRAERRDRASRNEIDMFLLDFHRLDMRLDDPIDRNRFGAIITLGRRYMLSAYDAAYLELALRVAWPLATRDQALAGAVTKAGATLFTA